MPCNVIVGDYQKGCLFCFVSFWSKCLLWDEMFYQNVLETNVYIFLYAYKLKIFFFRITFIKCKIALAAEQHDDGEILFGLFRH